MEIQLNPKSARAMAARLRSELNNGTTVSASQELLAKILGYHNWDTLSGVLKKKEGEDSVAAAEFQKRASRWKYRETPPRNFKPFTLYIDAYACDEWGEGPRWLQVEVTPELVAELHKLQTTVITQDVDMVTQDDSDGVWGEADHLNLRYDAVQVQADRFWWKATPKHQDYHVESRYIVFEELFQLIEQGAAANTEYFAWCQDKLFRDPNSAKDFAEDLYGDGFVALDEDELDKMPGRATYGST